MAPAACFRILPFVLLAAAGCTTARMVPPSDVAQRSDAIQATERSGMSGLFVNEAFRLGPYEVTKVDRDWNRSRGGSIGLASINFSSAETRTGYSFQFEEGAEKLPAQCFSVTSRKGVSRLKFSVTSEKAKLVCACGDDESAARIEIEGLPGRAAGKARIGDASYEVQSVHRIERGGETSDAAGYRVDADGGPAGAVEVLRPGRLWLSRSLDAAERRQLGCLLAGLMLYVEPSED